MRTSQGRPQESGQRIAAVPAGRAAWWTGLTALEVVLAATAVVLDLALPSLVILALMTASLLLRRQSLSSVGWRRPSRVGRLAATMFVAAVAWTLVDVGLLKPVEAHLSGLTQDMSQFESLRGDVGLLLVWLALSWVVAAFGETLAFIGYLQTRLRELIGSAGVGPGAAVVLASVVASLLLGLLHTEYGFVGVSVSTVNGLFYCFLRYRYRTLWAPILAHGFINTIGLVTVFCVGPVHTLW